MIQAAEGGLGLGLFLAKRIAELHGGALTVESDPGQGARFVLSLPCRLCATAEHLEDRLGGTA
jgi:signal transduction histidine kinase